MSKGFANTSKHIYPFTWKPICVTLLAVTLFFCLTVTSGSLAHAATLTSSKVSSGCAVMNVKLNGNQPATVTCVQKQTSGIQPNIGTTSCGGNPDFLMISSGTYWCFAGGGYISSGTVGISGWYNVTYLASFHCSVGWIKAYPGGTYPGWGSYGGNWSEYVSYSDVTQVDITAIDC